MRLENQFVERSLSVQYKSKCASLNVAKVREKIRSGR